MMTCPPTDLRLPSRLEHEARLIVAEQLGARIVHVDKRGGVDFCVERGGAHAGVLEVTRETDERWLAQEAQLKHQGWVFQTTLFEDSWQVDLSEGVVPGKLDTPAIAKLLAAPEMADIKTFPTVATSETDEVEKLANLGIESGYRRDEPGGMVYLGSPGLKTWMGSDHLNEVVAFHEDANRPKLATASGERHLFIWVEFQAIPVWVQVTEGPIPDSPPPITDVDLVWVASRHQDGLALLRADTGGWNRLAP